MNYIDVCSGISAPTAGRFWRKVKVSDGCWEWQASFFKSGYGKFGMKFERWRTVLAHRVAFALEHGHLSQDELILHRCDNRRCVRPSHLFLGSFADNVADMMSKSRWRGYDKQGAANPAAKLNQQQVLLIRGLAESGVNQGYIAERFGVSRQLVSAIKHGKVWQCAI